jgi:hypothetical protein
MLRIDQRNGKRRIGGRPVQRGITREDIGSGRKEQSPEEEEEK